MKPAEARFFFATRAFVAAAYAWRFSGARKPFLLFTHGGNSRIATAHLFPCLAPHVQGCEASKFPWTYSGTETCYILEGEVVVTPDDGRAAVTVGKGDMVIFPDGMSCTWDVKSAIKKHYNFS